LSPKNSDILWLSVFIVLALWGASTSSFSAGYNLPLRRFMRCWDWRILHPTAPAK